MSATRWSWIVVIALAPAVATLAVWDDAASSAEGPTVEWLKRLVGTWVRVDEAGEATDEVVSVYRETAGGSAIIETLFPGTDHEMITLYHQDNGDLVLTHYCVLGNQPRMKAAKVSTRDKIVFQCAGGSNMKSENDHHMHQGTVTFVNDNEIQSEWVSMENGEVNHKVALTVRRKS